jgi:uncharacterized protein YegP (UPF0339 family)
MAHPEFQVSSGKDDKFYFNLTAGNGQVILSSQGYKGKEGCENGIASVKKNSSNKKHFERKDSKVIGKSQMYKSNESSENGIQSIKTNARKAKVHYM